MKYKYLLIFFLLPLIITCSKDADINSVGGSESGTGGSLARFTIVDNHLYTVDHQTLKVFDVSESINPEFIKSMNVGFGIETIFPKDTLLFLGSQLGMYIYSIKSPATPEYISLYEHVFSCDPVVVEGKYAYVTLHSRDSWCGRMSNELQIIDISNIYSPQMVQSYPMENPLGLGIDNGELFLCDNALKVYDASDPLNLNFKQSFYIEAFDVIPLNGLLLVIGENGLYQYSYSGSAITLISKIEKEPTLKGKRL